ncbi:helix-turn-helix transcriptional regulator [Paenibacillus sp. ISL-20]|uniref:helix-turn-helix transcriptional regulator n=1 Tax=Paenibacillus sp. ISL-20 TaxID=2819163 RepID=UPI001BE6E018|nr:helix-turn-helix transcriptional regulator [Paenibacillus sp. ISL-20]MBT2759954.1 helix-turn-helix transcriptional regulator [Paenibacillus sp. ISL-20]
MTKPFRTWKDIKAELDYASETKKKAISFAAQLTNTILKRQHSYDISTADLANKAGVNAWEVEELKREDVIPSFDLLIKLAIALDVEFIIK